MRVESGGEGGGGGVGRGGGHHLCAHISLVLQQQSSSGVPLALAGEVQKGPVSFEARIGADVLQSSSKRRDVITARGSSGRCAGKRRSGIRGHDWIAWLCWAIECLYFIGATYVIMVH
jgi:hypothetical protein